MNPGRIALNRTPVGPYSEVIGAPGLANGGVVVDLDNSLWGAEINYRRFIRGNACARLDGIAGFRYLNFTENLSITETFVRTPNSNLGIGTPATSGIVQDQFRAENNFYGGQIGLTGEVRRGRWFLNGRSSIAFGTVRQTATIAGGQALSFADGSVGQYAGGDGPDDDEDRPAGRAAEVEPDRRRRDDQGRPERDQGQHEQEQAEQQGRGDAGDPQPD